MRFVGLVWGGCFDVDWFWLDGVGLLCILLFVGYALIGGYWC